MSFSPGRVRMARTYGKKVRSIETPNLLAYYPVGHDANDHGFNSYDGTTYGVTYDQAGIGEGSRSGLWDGVNDSVLPGAGVRTNFDGHVGTIAGWFKVSAAGVWTDGTVRFPIRLLYDSNNAVSMQKASSSNQLDYNYRCGGTAFVVNYTLSTTDWFHWAMTYSDSSNAGEVKAYANGSQVGSTVTVTKTWAGGTLDSDFTCLGSFRYPSPTYVWSGNLAHVALWNTVLTADEIAKLAGVTG